jgi:hypothetical protein
MFHREPEEESGNVADVTYICAPRKAMDSSLTIISSALEMQ